MSRESDETGQAGQTLSVLRDIWHAREQTDLDGLFSHTKSCKAMANVGFQGGRNAPVDDDLRTAWRDKLAREGKLHPNGESLRDMLFDQPER
jgi:hypothetical protein